MKIIAITPRKKTDALASLIIEGMKDMGIEIIASDTGNGIEKSYSDGEVIEHSKDADYIFVFFGKSGGKKGPADGSQKAPKYYLLDRIDMPDKTAYIDGSEWTYTGHADNMDQVACSFDENRLIHTQALEAKFNSLRYRGEPWINEEMVSKCKWYFKRECYPEDAENGIIPLPFGLSSSYFNVPKEKKDYDIFYAFGQKYTGLRYEVDHHCRNFASQKYAVFCGIALSKKDYRDCLSGCHIAISAWGGGNCCMREWEILASSACCFVQSPMILYPDRLVDGEHWVEYSSQSEFVEKLDYYLNDGFEECLRISQNGHKFAKEYHSAKARVKYMLDIMEKG